MGLIERVKKILAKIRAGLQQFVTEEVKHQAEEKVKKAAKAKVEVVKTKAKAKAKKKIQSVKEKAKKKLTEKLDGAE